MNKVTWLIEPEVFHEDSKLLIESLERLDVDHVVCKFGTSYEHYISQCNVYGKVVFQGSLQFAKRIIEANSNIKVFGINPKFDCLYYYPKFGNQLLNDNYFVLPFGDLIRKKGWIHQTLEERAFFIRPCSGNKVFGGKVIDIANWDKEIKTLSLRVNPQEPVVIAKPKKIVNEWRAIVVNNKVISISQYKQDGEIVRISSVPNEVYVYAQYVLDTIYYKPDLAWTLDICEEEYMPLKVLEVGTFSCAGLYACDYDKVINTINEIV